MTKTEIHMSVSEKRLEGASYESKETSYPHRAYGSAQTKSHYYGSPGVLYRSTD
jgi:hypothetical protein